MFRRFCGHQALAIVCIFSGGAQFCFGGDQAGALEPDPLAIAALIAPDPPPALEQKRVLWILPNYKTSSNTNEYTPLSASEKFTIATKDSFDRGIILMSLGMAGKGELFNATPPFGHGVAGYAKYFGSGYADLVLGNYLTEAVYPALLHQDPRYFRLGAGSGWKRLGRAMGQILWTRSDSGRGQFNFSEILGNATAVAISNAYYPNDHTREDALEKLSVQLGLDMSGNVMKEFWPDISRWLHHRHAQAQLEP